MSKKLLEFLKVLAIICVLLVLLMFIYGSTYQPHVVNEIKYKETFDVVTPADDVIRKPTHVGLPKDLLSLSKNESEKQIETSRNMHNTAKLHLNSWDDYDMTRNVIKNNNVRNINAVADGIKEFTAGTQEINRNLHLTRNGDPNATNPLFTVGTYDATLFL